MQIRRLFVGLIFIHLIVLKVLAQDIRINEMMSSNTIFFDEDGDTPDGFELHNSSLHGVRMDGWSVTDDLFYPEKWILPDTQLLDDEYLWIWASGKDRATSGSMRTLVDLGATFKYLLPQKEVRHWMDTEFDDSEWLEGVSGFGNGDNDDATLIPQGNPVVFVRTNFTIDDPRTVERLLFHIDYDDAFVAYINGTEIARANINGTPPAYYAYAHTLHEAKMYRGIDPELYTVTDIQGLLREGDNVLSIQVHNISASSSDLSLIPFLTAVFSVSSSVGSVPPAFLEVPESHLHTNFKFSSNGETLYLFNGDRVLVDSMQMPPIPSNYSYGLSVINDENNIFIHPTLGYANNEGYYGVINNKVQFSHQGGYTSAISLVLSGNEDGQDIRYTLDSRIPTSESLLYTNPIRIAKTEVVRARIFKNGYLPSETETRTYYRNTQHNMAIISLVTDPGNLFDKDTGMYVLGEGYSGSYPYLGSNIWEDWERPVHFSFYENNGILGVELDAGLKIFGGWSRGNDQRSFSIFARKAYGASAIEYPLFRQLPYAYFESIILRNSGNDWLNTMMRDAALTTLMEGAGIDYGAYRPCATYINGAYWGFYNMREKLNEHSLASRNSTNADDIDLLELGGDAVHGENDDYLSLIAFLNGHSLNSDANFKYVAERIDVDNFIMYQIAQIFINNQDWPGNNIKYWRSGGGRWRWILYDTDFGFGTWGTEDYYKNTLEFALDSDGPGWPNPPWSTLMLRKLMENESFENRFINRFCDELNSRFLSQNVQAHIETVKAGIASEIEAHYERWGGDFGSWANNINNMKTFATWRPYYVRKHLKSHFALSTERTLNIKNSELSKGYVRVNSLDVKETNWNGRYYAEVPIGVRAIPQAGYRFSHWSGFSSSQSSSLQLSLEGTTSLEAHFVAINGSVENLVINEINYQSSEENYAEDWIELYNPNLFALNLSRWFIKDEDDDHRFEFPDGTMIEPQGYLVVVRDRFRFESVHPNVKNSIGNFSFGLSSKNDMLRLYNSSAVLQDSVTYGSVLPWTVLANGLGYTLELIDPTADNTRVINWDAIHPNGSPGESNILASVGSEIKTTEPIILYPNPAKNGDVIKLLGTKISSSLKVYNVQGVAVPVQSFTKQSILLKHIPQGMYIISFVDEQDKRIHLQFSVQ